MQTITKEALLDISSGPEVHFQMIEGVLRKTRYGKIFPLPEQEVFAEELLRYLTAKAHLDGAWRMVWKNPKKSYWDKMGGMFRAHVPTVIEMEFLDKDGDVVCSTYSDDPIWKMLDAGMTHYANHAYDGVMAARAFLRHIDIKPEQTYKRALGEKPSDPLAEVPL